MKKLLLILFLLTLMLLPAMPVVAHFGMLIPSDSMILQEDDRNVHLTLSFSHIPLFQMIGIYEGF